MGFRIRMAGFQSQDEGNSSANVRKGIPKISRTLGHYRITTTSLSSPSGTTSICAIIEQAEEPGLNSSERIGLAGPGYVQTSGNPTPVTGAHRVLYATLFAPINSASAIGWADGREQ